MEDRLEDHCSNCRYCLKLTKYDYSNGGCEHIKLEGFACLAFASEGDAIWMVGIDPTKELCEEWSSKERNKPRINPNCTGLGTANCDICDYRCPYR